MNLSVKAWVTGLIGLNLIGSLLITSFLLKYYASKAGLN